MKSRNYYFLLLPVLLFYSCAKKIQSEVVSPVVTEKVVTSNNQEKKSINKSQAAVANVPKTMSDCIDPSRRRLEVGCPDESKTVCGCNNKTYKNPCEAEREGVTSYTLGKCIPVSDF